ncbi:MAG: hypothetical protein M1823_006110 [Watsoniomyces obsoletus]|nr:MAG: hypothetical protein M1823_006110 [Watsoniomyces obsoletus]
MHELLLLGTVPASRHDQLLKILAGITGMPPNHVLERHVVFKPKRSPSSREVSVGASQAVQNQQIQALQGQMKGELFHLQLVGDISDARSPSEVNQISPDDETQETQDRGDTQDEASSIWSLCFYDLPEVGGRRPVTSRMISKIDILEGDGGNFMDSLGYTYTSDYALEGQRLILNNVILLLHRLFYTPRLEAASSTTSNRVEKESPRTPADGFSDLESWSLLDPSGGYILQASVRVQDGGKPESMTLAVNELLAIKETLKGLVELEPGDRLAMDTRVK